MTPPALPLPPRGGDQRLHIRRCPGVADAAGDAAGGVYRRLRLRLVARPAAPLVLPVQARQRSEFLLPAVAWAAEQNAVRDVVLPMVVTSA